MLSLSTRQGLAALIKTRGKQLRTISLGKINQSWDFTEIRHFLSLESFIDYTISGEYIVHKTTITVSANTDTLFIKSWNVFFILSLPED